jgi:hypothetical protein
MFNKIKRYYKLGSLYENDMWVPLSEKDLIWECERSPLHVPTTLDHNKKAVFYILILNLLHSKDLTAYSYIRTCYGPR